MARDGRGLHAAQNKADQMHDLQSLEISQRGMCRAYGATHGVSSMTSETTEALAVEYFHALHGVGPANVMWRGRWPMRHGTFPQDHPVGGTSLRDGSMQFGTSDKIAAFRAKGYWASCFPEGDGMIIQTDRDADAVVADLKDCFGWRVKIKRR